jgi:bifunctional DNase/RNase
MADKTMSVVPDGFVEVSFQGIVNIKGPECALPVILLKDAGKRTMAIPLGGMEADLIRHALDESPAENRKGPRPYLNLIACLSKLDAAVQERTTEVLVPCSEAVACARLAQAPIYVEEELLAAIGAEAT